MKDFKIIPREFYNRDTVLVARQLLGKYLVRKTNNQYLVGIITETEAYTQDDPASHCYVGLTERNKSTFGPVGHSYVYISYGIHHCVNIVSRDVSKYQAGGTLIRSVIPIYNLDLIKNNRDNKTLDLNGPGKLTQGFLIDKNLDGMDLTNTNSELFVAFGKEIENNEIIATPRIGISKAKDRPWRFYIKKMD